MSTWSNDLAERSVLGSMMICQDVIDDVLGLVKGPEFFHNSNNGKVFYAIRELYTKGARIDLLTLDDAIGNEVDTEYLMEIQEGVISSENAVYYADIVRDYYIKRRVYSLSDKMKPHKDLSGIDVLHKAQEEIACIYEDADRGETVSMYDLSKLMISKFNEIYQSGNSGISCGFRMIDDFVGGFEPGQFILLAGRPSMGKSTLAMNMAYRMASNGLSVAFFSFEVSKEGLYTNLVSYGSRVPSAMIRRGTLSPKDMEKMVEQSGYLSSLPLQIYDRLTSTSEVRSILKSLKRSRGLDIVIFDYLQPNFIKPSGYTKSRYESMSNLSSDIKSLARDLEVPVVGLAQLNRSVEAREDKRPKLSDLRESGNMEQDADIVLMVYRDFYYSKKEEVQNHVEVLVNKHRNGPTGTVKMGIDLSKLSFLDESPFNVKEYYKR